jgi:hypothetical protein
MFLFSPLLPIYLKNIRSQYLIQCSDIREENWANDQSNRTFNL